MTAPICPISLATGPRRSRRAINEACKVAGIGSAGNGLAPTPRRPGCRTTGFEHGLGQLLDEQRYAVGALDNLVDDVVGEAGVAGKPLDQRGAVPSAEPVQRQHRHMRLSAPGVLKLGSERNDEQDG